MKNLLGVNGFRAANLIAHAQYQLDLTKLLVGMEGQSEAATIDACIAFRRRWRLACPEVDRDWYLVGLHRQRYRSRLVDPAQRGYSGKWLYERGYSLEHDQVFASAVAKPEPGK